MIWLVTRTDAASTLSRIIEAVTPWFAIVRARAALKPSWSKVSIVPGTTAVKVMMLRMGAEVVDGRKGGRGGGGGGVAPHWASKTSMRHVSGGGEGGVQSMPMHSTRSSSGSGPHRASFPQPASAGGGEGGAHRMSLHGAISSGSGPHRASMPQPTGAGGGLASAHRMSLHAGGGGGAHRMPMHAGGGGGPHRPSRGLHAGGGGGEGGQRSSHVSSIAGEVAQSSPHVSSIAGGVAQSSPHCSSAGSGREHRSSSVLLTAQVMFANGSVAFCVCAGARIAERQASWRSRAGVGMATSQRSRRARHLNLRREKSC